MDAEITGIHALSGGDINEVYSFQTHEGRYVLKVNSKDRFPEMFLKEAKGLSALSDAGVRAPQVRDCFEAGRWQMLVLEYIEQERTAPVFWTNFGRDLARLHRKSSPKFGFEHDNYIGTLPQLNAQKEDWCSFFVEQRMLPLVEKARELGRMGDMEVKDFERFLQKLPELLPEEPPSLLHGDLWSGNLMHGKGQQAVFIDPAVYFGHREVDLAMTQMFGGFDQRYLDSYREVFPLEAGWQDRLEIYNLYPNLVHLVLFGRSYLYGIQQVLRNYG